MTAIMEVGTKVKDSPMGAGTITGFSERGYPQVDNVAVGWVQFLDGTYYDPNNVAENFQKRFPRGNSQERAEYVAALEAVMENVDPAVIPGLTAQQRCLLGKFAKPHEMRELKTHVPVIEDHGLIAVHDYACPVQYADSEPSVYNLNTGVFHPSHKAHLNGWRLLRLKGWFEHLVYSLVFDRDQDRIDRR